jgi:hypothetical protein
MIVTYSETCFVKKSIPINQSESTKTDEKPLWITATVCYTTEIESERPGIVITAGEVSRRP